MSTKERIGLITVDCSNCLALDLLYECAEVSKPWDSFELPLYGVNHFLTNLVELWRGSIIGEVKTISGYNIIFRAGSILRYFR